MPASTQQKLLLGKFHFTSMLLVETGLHIGGGGENLAHIPPFPLAQSIILDK